MRSSRGAIAQSPMRGFDHFDGGYVAYGHPTVETHRRMAEQLISQMDTFHLFREQGE